MRKPEKFWEFKPFWKVEVIKACNFQPIEKESFDVEITHSLQLKLRPVCFPLILSENLENLSAYKFLPLNWFKLMGLMQHKQCKGKMHISLIWGCHTVLTLNSKENSF